MNLVSCCNSVSVRVSDRKGWLKDQGDPGDHWSLDPGFFLHNMQMSYVFMFFHHYHNSTFLYGVMLPPLNTILYVVKEMLPNET